jgi:nucleotide-binding universal stress UspA family protein
MYQRILIPVDISEPAFAEQALEAVKRALLDPETCVRFVTVLQSTSMMMGEYVPVDFDSRAREEATTRLSAIVAKSGLPPERVSLSVRNGGVTHEVNAEVAAFNADLVVIGSHRPSMATYLLGSSATSIVRHAKCSVLVVR